MAFSRGSCHHRAQGLPLIRSGGHPPLSDIHQLSSMVYQLSSMVYQLSPMVYQLSPMVYQLVFHNCLVVFVRVCRFRPVFGVMLMSSVSNFCGAVEYKTSFVEKGRIRAELWSFERAILAA